MNALYDVVVRTHPEVEGKSAVLAEMLSGLGIFTELRALNVQPKLESEIKSVVFAIESNYKIASEAKKLAMSQENVRLSNKSPHMERIQKEHEERKGMEEECYVLLSRAISYAKEGITKASVTELLFTLVILEDAKSTEAKCEAVRKALGMRSVSVDEELKQLARLFRVLAKASIDTRHVTRFIEKFKEAGKPSSEKQTKECTFVPQINQKSRAISGAKRTNSEKKVSTASSGRTSPQKHEELYNNYKEKLKNLELAKRVREMQSEKELTFKPQILNTSYTREDTDRVLQA